jgi:hypothetical protein
MKKVKIKEGSHLASNQFTGIRTGLFGLGKVSAVVSFNEDSVYLTKNKDNQPDWNKLMGCSWGFFPLFKQFQMHENSSRWVWRWNPDEQVFELAPYVYINGIRIYAETGSFPILKLKMNQEIYLALVPLKDESRCYFRYTYDVKNTPFGTTFGDLETLCYVDQPISSISGFIAPGYFGGTEPAPRDISYYYEAAE